MKIIILTILIATQQLFALISIAPVEIGAKPGLNGKVSTSLQTKRGSTDKENYQAGAKITYDSDANYVTWIEVSGEYGQSNKIKDTNKLYSHLRHIQAITDKELRGELFGQIQADEFKLINNRSLAGAGIRYRLFDNFKNSNGYLGLGGFYEYITYTSSDPLERNIRANTYFAYSAKFNKTSSLAYTFYYQPLMGNFHDFVTTNSLQIKLQLYKTLFLNFQFSYDLDTKPPIGVYKDDLTQTTTFVFEF